MKNKIILASASPRRCEILKNIGMEFTVVPSDADESSVESEGVPVEIYVQELALLKAMDVAKKTEDSDTLIIGADTVVSINGKILGKPGSYDNAVAMLKSLSGKVHEVYTGFAVVSKKNMETVCGFEKTEVEFCNLTDDEIKEYVDTNESVDKAGAYGIQGKGALLVKGINGDYFNVVGLPVRSLVSVMKENFGY